jgi:molecular chaperone DnaK
VFSSKRFMGRKFSEPQTQEETKRVPFKVVAAANGDSAIEIRGKRMSPPEIAARILMKLKRAAEEYLGEPVTEAVITVPAYFNDTQRQATKDAGKIAGLEVKRIINEPTAAALAYGLDKTKEHLIAVFDLGGGTFDISVLEVGDKVVEVIATNGDTHLGGDDIDNHLMDWLIAEFKKDSGIDVSKDKMVLQRLKEASEKAKIELSSVQETEINLPYITADASGPKHLLKKLGRAKLEQMIEPSSCAPIEPCKRALADAGLKKVSDINEVVLVGGSTRIPLVRPRSRSSSARSPTARSTPTRSWRSAPRSRAACWPATSRTSCCSTSPRCRWHRDPGRRRHPAHLAQHDHPDQEGGDLLHRGRQPDHGRGPRLQGERPMAKDNKTLGKFQLTGIPPAPRGVPQVEVTFDIDANGIVNVTAKDKATGVERAIRIEASSGLSEADIKRAVDDAERHESEDKARKDSIEARNQLDNLIYSTKKLVSEQGAKLADTDKLMIEEELKRAEEILEKNREGGNADDLRSAFETLQTATHKLAENMYKAAGAEGGGAPADAGAQGGQGDVIDAEFEDKA